jgi:hypothetical protein
MIQTTKEVAQHVKRSKTYPDSEQNICLNSLLLLNKAF